MAAGTTIALLPIGGTERNDVHMALGKHNTRVRLLAERIAQRLGNAVVAPVVADVPEGRIDPPSGHMRWLGTISIADAAFESVLEGAARSLQRAGLVHVVLLGDHGGYRPSLDRVAARLANVHALPEYYRTATTDSPLPCAHAASAKPKSAATPAALDASLATSPGEGADGDARRADAERPWSNW